MKAIHKNIELREHVDRSRSWSRAAAVSHTEATGVEDSYKLTGRWDEILAEGESLAAAPADAWELSITAKRLGGDMGELTVTRKENTEPAPGSGEAAELGTVDNPTYTCSYSLQPEPLLVHPMFAGLSDAERWLLQQVESGAHPDSQQEYGGMKGTLRQLCAAMSGTGQKALSFYLRGVTQYYEVHGEATARWTGTARSYEVGKTCTPPGQLNTPAGRSWICCGNGVEESGDKVVYTSQFRLSGRGGWDAELYK